jgi:acetate kinase
MKILVANLGSTSFKYRLFDMTDEKVLARGGVERIGSDQARCFVEVAGVKEETTLAAKDHAVAVRLCLKQLVEKKALDNPRELAAIGFKAVHAQQMTGVHRVDEKVLAAMEAFNDVAPAHNPPYVAAMRLLNRELPEIPLVAAFESGFHQTIGSAQYLYAVPIEWAEKYGIRRWGFHGASHRYIAERAPELLNKPHAKIISCHLGGSSSLCLISCGQSRATSMGMSPQSGLPQNNRVGDFDPFALPVIMRATGKTLEQVLDDLANRSGLLGLCGHNDMRDILAELVNLESSLNKDGPEDDESPTEEEWSRYDELQTALEVYVGAIRQYLGSYLLLMNGVDAIIFTGGIGENSPQVRTKVCANLDWFGIHLDPVVNERAFGWGEIAIHSPKSRVELWIMPTNEELIVARQTRTMLTSF